MSLRRIVLLLSALALCLWAGCGTTNIGARDWGTIESTPAGALVYDGPELLGATPLTVSLERGRPHSLKLVRRHFRPFVVHVTPERTEAGRSYPRFGILDDLGAYEELKPSEIAASLVPELVPEAPGGDPYAELAARVLVADSLLEQGELSPGEHAYIVRSLAEYFGGGRR